MSKRIEHPILSGMLMQSLRYGGYRNPAYAIAELIDNSFEAGARNVELLCKDTVDYSEEEPAYRLEKLALVDNGPGMSYDELWDSLALGRGTRMIRQGIGRFGMGLPCASLSQCKRVDVYSWQNDDGVFHTWLDFDEIIENKLYNVPKPKREPIDSLWVDTSKFLPTSSGTVVVWSKLDRCVWKNSDSFLSYSEHLISRIYRRFLDNKKHRIRMSAIGESGEITREISAKPNDPLHQMKRTSTPARWGHENMFNQYGDVIIVHVKDADGIAQQVAMRFALTNYYAGGQYGLPQSGKSHLGSNSGVSVIRAGREIYLDTHLVKKDDPTEGWWGAEIEFPPALDEFFGITNNKQEAINFSAMTGMISPRGIKKRQFDVLFDRVENKQMADIVKIILENIQKMRKSLKTPGNWTVTSDRTLDLGEPQLAI